jgi:predicted AlkP superfamily phosphohydrolase/phosphomutase
VIWTSIATGTAPEKHGISGFWHESTAADVPRAPGETAQIEQLRELGYIESPPVGAPTMVMYRASERRTPALWNLLDAHGLASTVVSWWVTYPAEAVTGSVISDRFLFSRFELVAKEESFSYEKRGRLVHPKELEEELGAVLVRVDDIDSSDLEPFVAGEIHLSPKAVLHSREDELRMVLAKDESVVRMAEYCLREDPASLLMMYIQGIDVVSHYFWKYRFAEEWNWIFPGEPVSEEDVARYGRTIEAYYRLQDRHLGDILRYADETTAILLCSDHGFTTGRRGHVDTVSGTHWMSAPPGILVMSGAGIRSGTVLDGAQVFDIAPTVLALMGLPPEPSMDGRVLEEAMVR